MPRRHAGRRAAVAGDFQLYPVNVEPESVDRVPSNANGTSATGCPATVAIPAVGTPVILSRWLELAVAPDASVTIRAAV